MANKLIEPVLNNMECEKIIAGTFEGLLAMCEDNQPYSIPINHAFYDGKLYFHCGLSGRKLDIIRNNPKVCYNISKYHGTHDLSQTNKSCHGPWESVIIYGNARIIEDLEEKTQAFKIFMKWYGVEDYKMNELDVSKTLIFIIDIESMTVRREMNNNCEYYQWLPE